MGCKEIQLYTPLFFAGVPIVCGAVRGEGGIDMSKDLRYASLALLYRALLTPYQRELVTDYFLLDLSMGEISAERGISRQCVNDGLKKAKEHLDAFEAALNLLGKAERLTAVADRIEAGESGKRIADELRNLFEES